MGHGEVEQEPLRLDRGPAMHPAFAAAMSEVNARVYDLNPPEFLPQDALNRLYTTFLHSLCGQEFSLFVSHTMWDSDVRALADFVARIRQVEPSVEVTELAWEKTGFLRRRRREPEITMHTNRLEALQVLFEHWTVTTFWEGWILDRPTTPFPLDAFRRLESPGGEDALRVWQSVVRDFVAFVQIREEHGPMIVTSKLDEETVVFAARETALALGLPLSLD